MQVILLQKSPPPPKISLPPKSPHEIADPVVNFDEIKASLAAMF